MVTAGTAPGQAQRRVELTGGSRAALVGRHQRRQEQCCDTHENALLGYQGLEARSRPEGNFDHVILRYIRHTQDTD